MSGWRPRLALLALGLAAAAVILEMGVRVLGLAPEIAPIVVDAPYASFVSHENEILRYVPAPGSRDVNDYGIRDRDYAFEREPGVYRVVVLGDSIAFGFCTLDAPLPPRATFAKVLESRLRADPLPGHTGAEVINLSVSGYDSLQEVEFLREKGLAFAPDLVLVGYCLNDRAPSSVELARLSRSDRWATLERLRGRALRPLLVHSHLARLVWYHGSVREPAGAAEDDAIGDRTERGFAELRALGEAHGFETLVAIFPYLDAARPYRHDALHARAAASARANGFAVLDLLPAFLQASEGDLSRLRGRCIGMHPDAEGHRRAALEMERAIRARFGGRSAQRAGGAEADRDAQPPGVR